MTAMSRILLSSPDVGDREHEFVLRALASGWVAPAGPDLEAFEREVAERVGVEHAVALASGTAALHLALVSWGVGPGDVVPVSTLTFAATINAIRYVGAEPFLVDSEAKSGNISPSLLDEALTHLSATGRRIPVVIPVDLFGKCVDYAAVSQITEQHGARLLADAAESLGATRSGRAAGSWGSASALSFNGNKIVTTSGGGMLLTHDGDLAAHVRKLSTQAREPVLHYEHTEVGYNYRLSNILAALGRAQLSRLDDMMKRRRLWRERYRALFASRPGVRILGGDNDSEDNCWLTAVVIDAERSSCSAEGLRLALDAEGIETRPVWMPMHLQPVFQGVQGRLDGTAEQIFREGLVLPSGSSLSDEQFSRVESAIDTVMSA